ncbi:MAG: hypothetical protein JW892_16740 [Anaerolineae bacterium]|nr:hypothetical protein [Anaerolineae bacterium]
MKTHVLPPQRAILALIGIALLMLSWASPPQWQVQASPLAGPLTEEEDGMHLKFLPAQMRQLCKGDSTTFTLWSYYYESPPDPNRPLVPIEPPAGPPELAPLVRYVEISALNGQVSPNKFLLTSPSQYMRFTYTAAGEGQDTITAVIDDGSASVEKRISVLPTCEYDISFLELSSQTIDTGGFYVAFKGDGEFFVNRTAESVGELAGSGQDDLAFLMWAFAPGAFSCTMDKITANSTFEVEGMLNAEPYNFLHVNVHFAPLSLPGTMVWRCNGVGLGEIEFNIPIEGANPDPETLEMVGLTFPLQGGVEEFEVPNGFGYVVVTRR